MHQIDEDLYGYAYYYYCYYSPKRFDSEKDCFSDLIMFNLKLG